MVEEPKIIETAGIGGLLDQYLPKNSYIEGMLKQLGFTEKQSHATGYGPSVRSDHLYGYYIPLWGLTSDEFFQDAPKQREPAPNALLNAWVTCINDKYEGASIKLAV
jgi:hypothetical protein